MKNILYSLKETFATGFSKLKNELPELIKFTKSYKLVSLIALVITIIIILLVINLTGINKTITGTVLSKYSVENITNDNNSKYIYHVIINKNGIFGMKEKEYLISNKDLYDNIKPELKYKLKVINNSYITKASEIKENK